MLATCGTRGELGTDGCSGLGLLHVEQAGPVTNGGKRNKPALRAMEEHPAPMSLSAVPTPTCSHEKQRQDPVRNIDISGRLKLDFCLEITLL